MGIGILMPHLLGVPVWDGRASAPKGADALCPHHMDILPFRRAPSVGGGHMDVTRPMLEMVKSGKSLKR
jgi:hypothetical protein